MRPEQIKVLGTCADGTVAVISFVVASYSVDGSLEFIREPSAENINAEVAKINEVIPSSIVSWRLIADEDVPAERDYRNAWMDTGRGVGHDMAKARAIHRDKLRVYREPLLAALDIEYQKADERDDIAEKRRIAAEKQVLRDITADPRIDATTTIEALRALRT